MVQIGITISDNGSKSKTAMQKLMTSVANMKDGEPKDNVIRASTALLEYAINTPRAYERIQTLLLELGDRTPTGDIAAICSGLNLLSAAESLEEGIDCLERLKRIRLRGHKIGMLINESCNGNASEAIAVIRWNLVGFELRQLRKQEPDTALKLRKGHLAEMKTP